MHRAQLRLISVAKDDHVVCIQRETDVTNSWGAMGLSTPNSLALANNLLSELINNTNTIGDKGLTVSGPGGAKSECLARY
jgi:hypothetical protein